MRLCTRRGWRDALATLCLAVVPCVAPAQTYPTKPIRILVGFAAGGPVDGVARVIAQALPAHLGQAVVVENRPGADANIAMEALARSAPDGYTLYLIQPGVAINPALYRSVPFDPINDFAPIVLIGSSPNLLAIARTLPAATLQEFIALAKARRGQLNYGATSSPTHLATELFNSMAGVEIVRVPFKGAPPALAALAAGDVQLVISSIGTLLPLHKAGKVRALAVTSSERSSIAPDIPTVAESGLPGYVATTWYGLAAPGATPPAIIDRLNRELRKTLAEPAVRTQLMNLGIDSITPGDPGELRELIRAELVKWDQVVKRSGARVD
jgi:tripartite-type tricarboxylate transporter receptor subunit TctC